MRLLMMFVNCGDFIPNFKDMNTQQAMYRTIKQKTQAWWLLFLITLCITSYHTSCSSDTSVIPVDFPIAPHRENQASSWVHLRYTWQSLVEPTGTANIQWRPRIRRLRTLNRLKCSVHHCRVFVAFVLSQLGLCCCRMPGFLDSTNISKSRSLPVLQRSTLLALLNSWCIGGECVSFMLYDRVQLMRQRAKDEVCRGWPWWEQCVISRVTREGARIPSASNCLRWIPFFYFKREVCLFNEIGAMKSCIGGHRTHLCPKNSLSISVPIAVLQAGPRS